MKKKEKDETTKEWMKINKKLIE